MREAQDSENTATREDLTNCTIVDQITVEMILSDLAQGRNKEKIRQKYAYNDENGNPQPFEKWMVDEMFKDPNLRGKKPARRKVLPFTFKGITNAAATPVEPSTVIEVVEPGRHSAPTEPVYGIPNTEGGHQMTNEGIDFDID